MPFSGMKRRGETRHFTYSDVGLALGLLPMTVKRTKHLRAMVKARDLLSLAREIVRRRGMA